MGAAPSRLVKACSVAALYWVFVVVVFKGALAFLSRWSHPAPVGGHAVGSLRGRLPARPGTSGQGLLAQVHYPASSSCALPDVETFEYCRPEVMRAVSEGYYVPYRLLEWVMAGRLQVDPPRVPLAPSTGKWPVVFFQPGLWGSFEFYSQLCRDMASAGTVVVLLEHEDGTSITAVDRTTGETIEYEEQPPWPYDLIDFNAKFLHRRKDELCEAVAAVQGMARRLGQSDDGSDSSGEPARSPLEHVMSCASPAKLILVGHSFGACGLVHTLGQEPPELADCCGALLMDLWPGPLTRDVPGGYCEELGSRFPFPHVTLLSEGWSDIEWYGPSCRRFPARSKTCLAAAVVPGAAHYWISDIQWWAPLWLLRLLRVMGPADAPSTYRSTVQAIHASFGAFLGAGKSSSLVADFANLSLKPIPTLTAADSGKTAPEPA